MYRWLAASLIDGKQVKTTALQSAVPICGELLETHIPGEFAHELSFAWICWERHHGHGWRGFASAGQWRRWCWWHGGWRVVIDRCVIRLEKHPNAAIFSYAVGHVEWIHPNCEFFGNDGKYDGLIEATRVAGLKKEGIHLVVDTNASIAAAFVWLGGKPVILVFWTQ